MRDAIRSARSRGRFLLFVLLGLQLLCGHRLASADELGHVQIKAPVGVEVQLDGKPLGTTGLDASGLLVPNVAPGEHTLLFTKPGFNAKEVRVVVVAGEVTEYTLDLSAAAPRVTQEGGGDSTRLAAASGSIQVSSLPIEAVISIPAAHIASNRKTQKTWTLQNAPAGPIEVIATALSKRLSCKFTLPPGGTAPVFFNFATMQAVGPVERAVAAATPKAEVGDWSAVDFELALGEPFGARAEDLADKHREPYRTWLAANGRSAAARAI
ncbi:MAG: hypothetical protein KDB73_18120, partial [Planctomycetes bacterium]|nr:hypothetical protein [Planctomycetota bacterium]